MSKSLDPSRTGQPTPAADAVLTGDASDPVRRALWLDAVDRQLRSTLPANLAPRFRVANIRGQQLVLVVDNPAWHARLRLANDDILTAARSIGLTVDSLRIRVVPPTAQAPAPASNPPPGGAREALAEVLSLLQDGPEPRK